MQGTIVKSLRVRHGRVLMAATAQTWFPVTIALVRQLTQAAPAPLRTASPTIHVSTVVLVTALGCVAVHRATKVVTARQLVNHIHLFTSITFTTRNREIIISDSFTSAAPSLLHFSRKSYLFGKIFSTIASLAFLISWIL